MKTRRALHMQYIIVVTLFLLGLTSARASTAVYDDFRVISEPTIFTTSFEVSSAGTYRAELVDLEYTDPFDILMLGITQGATPLGFGFDTGAFTFQVTTPGTLQAHVAALPLAGKLGTYALQIFAVPLPPAMLLFLSGLLGLVTVGRRDSRLNAA